MDKHGFLFKPGAWLGEGKIAFQGSKDTAQFYTRWTVKKMTADVLVWLQEVELHGLNQTNENLWTITELKQGHFQVTLENELMGIVRGKGVADQKSIAWELRNQPGVEGFEVFDLQENGEYRFHAEYASEQFRTKIDGRIWSKQ